MELSVSLMARRLRHTPGTPLGRWVAPWWRHELNMQCVWVLDKWPKVSPVGEIVRAWFVERCSWLVKLHNSAKFDGVVDLWPHWSCLLLRQKSYCSYKVIWSVRIQVIINNRNLLSFSSWGMCYWNAKLPGFYNRGGRKITVTKGSEDVRQLPGVQLWWPKNLYETQSTGRWEDEVSDSQKIWRLRIQDFW